MKAGARDVDRVGVVLGTAIDNERSETVGDGAVERQHQHPVALCCEMCGVSGDRTGCASVRSAADTGDDTALLVDDDLCMQTFDGLGVRVSAAGAAYKSVELIAQAVSTPDLDASFIAVCCGCAEPLNCLLLRATRENDDSADDTGLRGRNTRLGNELVEYHRSRASSDES